jgi:hypothetical protein
MTFQKTIEYAIQSIGLIELRKPECAANHKLSDLHVSFTLEAAKLYEQYGLKPRLLLSFSNHNELQYAALMPLPDRYIDCLGIHNLSYIVNNLGDKARIERHTSSAILSLHKEAMPTACLQLGPQLIAQTLTSLQRLLDQGEGEEAWTSM